MISEEDDTTSFLFLVFSMTLFLPCRWQVCYMVASGDHQMDIHVLSEAKSRLCAVLTAHPEISSELASIKVALSNAVRDLEMKQNSWDQRALPPPLEPKVQQLEQELEGRHESEMRLLDSLLTQTKQLEETKISLEESKLVISSLKGRPEMIRNLSYDELRSVEKDLAHTKEREKVASLKVESLADQLKSVKSQLELVTESEEHQKKAMDQLALALKEVATDAKEQLTASQKEAEQSKSEAEEAKLVVKSMRSKFRVLLDEARQDSERHLDTSERLTQESLSAWHEKEARFVECINNAEQDKSLLQKENTRLVDALAQISKSKEENDTLKKEANDAREAVTTAKEENTQLKDSLAEKEITMEKLNQEMESLKAEEASARDKVKELKKFIRQTELSQSGFKAMQGDDIWKVNTHKSTEEKEANASPEKGSNLKKLGSLMEMKSALSMEDHDTRNKDTGKDEALKGSIFDMSSPVGHGPSPNRKKSLSLSFADDTAMEYEQQEQEAENEKHPRKKKTLFKKFGYMLRRRRSFQRRERDIK